MVTFKIKQKDTLAYLKYQLVNSDDGTPYQLDGDETITFYLRNEDNTQLVLTGVASISNASQGILQYIFSAADTTTSGIYEGEFQIVKGSAKLTVPSENSLFIHIYDDINE
jgi:hypothetical protein